MDMQQTKVIKKIQITPTIFTLRFDYKVDFKPGQFVMVQIGQTKKPFSISSSPLDENLCITVKDMGGCSRHICALSDGDDVLISKPMGHMVLNEQHEHSNVFITGGSGIGPFLGMLSYARDKPLSNKQYLFYSAKTVSEVSGFMQHMGTFPERFCFFWHVTRPELEPQAHWSGARGRITLEHIKSSVSDFIQAHFYIVGDGKMVIEFEEKLLDAGIPREQVHRERWN